MVDKKQLVDLVDNIKIVLRRFKNVRVMSTVEYFDENRVFKFRDVDFDEWAGIHANLLNKRLYTIAEKNARTRVLMDEAMFRDLEAYSEQLLLLFNQLISAARISIKEDDKKTPDEDVFQQLNDFSKEIEKEEDLRGMGKSVALLNIAEKEKELVGEEE